MQLFRCLNSLISNRKFVTQRSSLPLYLRPKNPTFKDSLLCTRVYSPSSTTATFATYSPPIPAIMASTSRPPWAAPKALADSSKIPDLYMLNSLTREKNKFVPVDPEGKAVKWYTCGPTVYVSGLCWKAALYAAWF